MANSSPITDDVFQHTAKLSHLEIKPEESEIKDQLTQAAEYVEILTELNTDKINPTFQVNHKTNVMRDDIIQPSLPQSLALSQAESVLNGYFRTSATIHKNK